MLFEGCVAKQYRKLWVVTQQEKLKLSLTEESEEEKSKLTASNEFLKPKCRGVCDSERIGLTINVEYFGIDARNQTRKLGKKKGGRRKQCAQIVGNLKEEVHMRNCTNKVLRMKVVPKSVCRAKAVGMVLFSKRGAKKTVGQCNGTESISIGFTFLGSQQSGD